MPITTDTPLEIKVCAAAGALACSEALSAVMSWILYSLPPMVTVGFRECAYSMPRISFLPPAAFWPEVGSKIPTLITSPSVPLSLLPQATSDSAVTRASSRAINFFILSSSINCLLTNCKDAACDYPYIL